MVIVMTLRTRGPDLALSLTSRLSTMLPAHPADLSRSIPDPGFAGPGINPCSSPTPHHVRVRVSANWFADPALASHLECVLGCMTNFQDVLWGQLNMHTGSFPAAWDCSVCQGMWLRPPPFNKPNKAQVRKGEVPHSTSTTHHAHMATVVEPLLQRQAVPVGCDIDKQRA